MPRGLRQYSGIGHSKAGAKESRRYREKKRSISRYRTAHRRCVGGYYTCPRSVPRYRTGRRRGVGGYLTRPMSVPRSTRVPVSGYRTAHRRGIGGSARVLGQHQATGQGIEGA
eukprot:3369732-Rhodomonas_salina.2